MSSTVVYYFRRYGDRTFLPPPPPQAEYVYQRPNKVNRHNGSNAFKKVSREKHLDR